jgi:hypothetical protein
MALSYPYALTVLADILPISDLVWDDQRNDEMSGSGDGRVWQSEQARPLWKADVSLKPMPLAEAKRINALLRKLHGAQESFWLYDPTSIYPQLDPDGSVFGASIAQVHSVASNRGRLRIKGLPSTYPLKTGGKGQITYGSPARSFFFEFSEDTTAVAGTTPEVEVFPHVPTGVVADDAVTLIRPACKMFITSRTAGNVIGDMQHGMSVKCLERAR